MWVVKASSKLIFGLISKISCTDGIHGSDCASWRNNMKSCDLWNTVAKHDTKDFSECLVNYSNNWKLDNCKKEENFAENIIKDQNIPGQIKQAKIYIVMICRNVLFCFCSDLILQIDYITSFFFPWKLANELCLKLILSFWVWKYNTSKSRTIIHKFK